MSLIERSFADQLTLTRAGAATFFGPNRLLQTAAADTRRIQFDPATGNPQGLLIEGARTNLLLQSSDLAVSPWNWNVANITRARDRVGLGGLPNTATALIETTNTEFRGIVQAVAVVAGSQYVFFAIVERTGPAVRHAALVLESGSAWGATLAATLNTTTGAVTPAGTGTNFAAGAIDMGGGRWLLWLSAQAVTTQATPGFSIRISNSPTNAFSSYAGDGLSGLIVYHSQVEIGARPTSPILTTTATVTRAADLYRADLTLPAGRWFDPTRGTFFVEWEGCSRGPNGNRLLGVGGVPSNDLLRFSGTIGTDEAPQLLTNNGTQILTATSAGTTDVTKPRTRGALSYSPAGRTIAVRGQTASDAQIAFPNAPTALFIGSANGFVQHADGIIRRVAYTPDVLTPAELAAITA